MIFFGQHATMPLSAPFKGLPIGKFSLKEYRYDHGGKKKCHIVK